MGARTMLLSASLYVVLSIANASVAVKHTKYGLRYLGIDSELMETLYDVFVHAFPLATLPIFYSCMVRPRVWLYVSTVSAYFFFLVIISIPATIDGGMSCGPEGCSHEKSSLRDHSTMHLLMCWILLTPSILPTQRMIHLTWVYIAVGYVGASLICHSYFNDGRNPDTGVADPSWNFSVAGCTTLLVLVNTISLSKKYYIEKGQRSKFVMDLKHKESTRRMFNILEYMVPVHLVAPMLKNPGKVIAEQVECASILFIMFVDFDQTASKLEPHELLDFLNHHFTLFDCVCARHSVTKVETVGEEYVCAVGVVPADVKKSKAQGHQEILGNLIAAASEILRIAEEDEKVDLKMGIHTGPVVAGVIGHKLPRFRLFGDTINTAARMMQKGLPGELQFGEETYRSLPPGVEVEHRGQVEMKGKGQVTTYLLHREKSSPAPPPPPAPDPPAKPAKRTVRFAPTVETDSAPSTRASKVSLSSRKSISQAIMGGISGLSPTTSFAPLRGRASTCDQPQAGRPAPRAAEQGHEVEMARLPSSGRASRPSEAAGVPLISDEEAGESVVMDDLLGASAITRGNSRGSMFSRAEDRVAAEAFERAVQEVCAASNDDSEGEEGEGGADGWKDRALRWVRSLGPGWNTFPKEMEEAFAHWYHETAIVKKFDRRMESHLAMGSAATAVDLLYAVFVTGSLEMNGNGQSRQRGRLPRFLASRLLICAIVACWRSAFDANWIRRKPRDVQFMLLITYSLIAFLWFVSYDALCADRNREMDLFSLLCVPLYLIVTTLHPLLFIHSCIFTAEAALLMYVAFLYFDHMRFAVSSMFIFVGNSAINAFFVYTHEKSLRARYKANASISLAQDRIEHILNTLMPVQVVEEIRENELHAPPRAHPYRCATVAQSDLCGFTKLASTRRPEEVVEFIGELFGAFDALTDEYEIYKVETVGDAYIAGQADVPLTYKNSPVSVVLFGLEMVRATHDWSRKRGESVSCRVGIHSGRCVGGIVGSEMQRYHLFGRLMTGLEVLESTAPEGRVQVSIACKEAVESQLREEGREVSMFEPRKEARLTTSKGEVHEFEEVGGPTFVAKSYAQIRGQLAH